MSIITLSKSTALVVIDVQQGFNMSPYTEKSRSTPDCVPNISRIISSFRSVSLPVIHVQHYSLEPTSVFNRDYSAEGYAIQREAAPIPSEPIFVKRVNSAFIGTDLEKHLRDAGIKTLVMVGLTTSHCVSTTVRMAGNLGWEVYVPRDATAMFARAAAPGGSEDKVFDAETMHEVALSELHGEFATVVTTNEVIRAVESLN
ncbi:isochorismatase [Collybia nuda]|uniref:Isochorismatase n=1 Tax=Collybia nuda TaxID=64659 RepID=A0A9P5XZ95_9AGAR|nr:isochorismatase [Collybia nuda]